MRNLATARFVHCGEFFVFIERDGVEPTNHAAAAIPPSTTMCHVWS